MKIKLFKTFFVMKTMRIYLIKTKAGKYLLTAEYPQSPGSSPKAESLLKTFSKATEITVVYPPELSESEAREIFRELILTQTNKHRRWLLIDGALLPFSIPLTLIPGPNLVLFYLAWRTYSHYQSHKGGRNALNGLPLQFVPAGN